MKQEPVLLVGITEIAAALGLGINRVQSMVGSSDFPAVKCGSRWLCTKDKLEEWADNYLAKEKQRT